MEMNNEISCCFLSASSIRLAGRHSDTHVSVLFSMTQGDFHWSRKRDCMHMSDYNIRTDRCPLAKAMHE